ncbi:hypothetical protein CLAFUW4_11134 [Fulvia fulva]|nr:hypothetical protein CLAFUR4_11139 [Fulvia fulva]KAK4620735.1 hypothetical protein CLAFUR0_11144 [Fulvia fulva]WPV17733.1 hypothetical protein CLAFUW4_11134 [Fulvia fulva]WPV32206.1 hypothetical protein CLAFUW7_11130 [Fulvia fulva]
MSGRHFNFIAFAALFVTITPVNGPLLQRSSTVGVKSIGSRATLQLPITRRVWAPTGFTSGEYCRRDILKIDALVSTRWLTGQAYYRSGPIVISGTGCPGDATCPGRLTGVGLTVNCSSASADFSVEKTDGTSSIRWESVNGTDVFYSKVSWNAASPGNLSLSIQYKATPDINGQLVVINCTLQTATVQYPVNIDGNSSRIALTPGTSVFDDVLLSMNPPPEAMYGLDSEIGGYALVLSIRFNAWTYLRWVGAAGYELRSQGPLGPQFASMEDVDDFFEGVSNVKFNDPTPYLLHQARELLFRTALVQGNGTSMELVQGASQIRTAGVYVSHYEFLGIAVAISLVAVSIVIAAYAGYCHLGREVSMSPIEIAKAFNAPLLPHEPSNANADELTKSAGGTPVRYGLLSEKGFGQNTEYRAIIQRVAIDPDDSWFEIADPSAVRSLRR